MDTLDSKDTSSIQLPLPKPPDGGWGWLIVAASFVINCMLDGICYSYGVFYVELLREFKESSAKTILVGSILPGVYLLIGPLVSALVSKYSCRWITIIGSVTCAAGIFLSSFATSLDMLIVLYGVIGGVGFGFMYLPSIVIVGYYFDKKRALATGVAVCGSGMGVFIFAPFASFLLENYGWRGGNQILAGILLNGIICGAVFRPIVLTVSSSTVVAPRVTIRSRNSPPAVRSLIIQKIIEEKKRQRTISTGSLDGTVITKDNTLIRPSDMSLGTNAFVTATPTSSLAAEAATASLRRPGSVVTMATIHEVNKTDVEQNLGSYDDSSSSSDAISNDGQHSPRIGGSTVGNNLNEDEQTRIVSPHEHEDISKSSDRQGDTKHSDYYSQITNPNQQESVFNSGNSLNLPDTRNGSDMELYRETHSEDSYSARGTKQTIIAPRKPSGCVLIKSMLDVSLLRSVTFIELLLAVVFPFMGFYVPFIYMTDYAIGLGMEFSAAAFLLSVLGISNAASRIVTGFLSDRKSVDCVVIHNGALIIAGVSTCLLPLMHTYTLLCVYCVIFGACIAAFISLKSIILVEILGLGSLMNAFGLVGLFQGIAAFVGSPLAGAIFDSTGSYEASFLMAGAMITMGGIICIPIRHIATWEKRKKHLQKLKNREMSA